MEKNKKIFDCYKCEYRGTIPGNAHSCCNYPGIDIADFFAPQNAVIGDKLNIRANPFGVRSGWFMYPVNFDPIWLDNCDGFKEKENESRI